MGVDLEKQKIVLGWVGLLAHFMGSTGSQFQGPVASTPRDPFTDSHAISTLPDVSVNDLDQLDMLAFTNEDTGGRS